MHASHQTIKPPLTKQISITCELNSTSSIVNNGHDASGKHPKECNVTSTAEEIEFISSIFMTKDTGEQVASVTEHDAAKLNAVGVYEENKEVVVTGNVTGAEGAVG